MGQARQNSRASPVRIAPGSALINNLEMSLLRKVKKSSPRRKPGSRSVCFDWIPAFAGMTSEGDFGLFGADSEMED